MTRLLVLPGDGIGPEVTRAATTALRAVAPDVELVEASVGRQALAETGDPVGPEARALLEGGRVEGIFFGATETRPGEPSAAVTLRELIGARISIRPARARHAGARPCDVTVYRELTEDLYVQEEEAIEDGARAYRPITRTATRAFAELAFDHLPEAILPTVAHKATILPATDGLFLETVEAVAEERGRRVRPRLVDALAHDLAMDPSGPMAILAPNFHGDLLSDLTAGLAGGLGLAPSLTLGDGVPMAEPVHGTAPDIQGQGIANPTAALLSMALLLDHLGHTQAAARLERAVDATLAAGTVATPDLGGEATTQTFTRAILDHVEVPA